jgi:hypothetical protein
MALFWVLLSPAPARAAQATWTTIHIGGDTWAGIETGINLGVSNGGNVAPTGEVVVREGNVVIGRAPLLGGSARIEVVFPTGVHTIVASYGGDGTFAPSTSPPLTFSAVRWDISMGIMSSAGGSIFDCPPPNLSSCKFPQATAGQPVTYTANFTKDRIPRAPDGMVPTGSITFRDGYTDLGTAPIKNGSATLTTSFTKVGSHGVSASFAGDQNFNPSSSGVLFLQVSGGATATTQPSDAPPSGDRARAGTTATTTGPRSASRPTTTSKGAAAAADEGDDESTDNVDASAPVAEEGSEQDLADAPDDKVVLHTAAPAGSGRPMGIIASLAATGLTTVSGAAWLVVRRRRALIAAARLLGPTG